MTQLADLLTIGQAMFQMAWPFALALGVVAGAVKTFDRVTQR